MMEGAHNLYSALFYIWIGVIFHGKHDSISLHHSASYI